MTGDKGICLLAASNYFVNSASHNAIHPILVLHLHTSSVFRLCGKLFSKTSSPMRLNFLSYEMY